MSKKSTGQQWIGGLPSGAPFHRCTFEIGVCNAGRKENC